MGTFVRSILFLAAVSCAFAQLDSNSITVTASRDTAAPPDQAVFAVSLETDFSAGLSDVLAVVEPVGLTISNFIGVNSAEFGGPLNPSPGGAPIPVMQSRLRWIFAVPISITKTREMASALTDLQQSVAQNRRGMRLTFSLQGTQASPQAQQSQACPLGDLIAEARAQAQKMAAAAGMTVGNVLSMSGSAASTAGSSGVFAGLLLGFPSSSVAVPARACFLTVKFALR